MKIEAACDSDGGGAAPWSNHAIDDMPTRAERNCSSVPQSCGAAPSALADQLLDFDAQLVLAFTAPDKELAALTPHSRLYAALAHVVALLGGPGINLSARPSNIDDSSTLPALYREQRLKRRYARARDVRMDMWKPHGGTSTRRLRLPDSLLEDGSEAQNLVRRSGKIVRPNGLPPLRYRQYELVAAVVDGVPPPPSQRPSTVAVFHVLPSAVGTVAPKKITGAEAAAATVEAPKTNVDVGAATAIVEALSDSGSGTDNGEAQFMEGWSMTSSTDSSSNEHSDDLGTASTESSQSLLSEGALDGSDATGASGAECSCTSHPCVCSSLWLGPEEEKQLEEAAAVVADTGASLAAGDSCTQTADGNLDSGIPQWETVRNGWLAHEVEDEDLPGSSKRQRAEDPDSEGETSSDNGSGRGGGASSSAPAADTSSRTPDATKEVSAAPATFAVLFEEPGTLGVFFSPDSSRPFTVMALLDNGLALRSPEIQPGCVLLSVQGEKLDGLSYLAGLAKITQAGRPLELVFERSDDLGTASTESSQSLLSSDALDGSDTTDASGAKEAAAGVADTGASLAAVGSCTQTADGNLDSGIPQWETVRNGWLAHEVEDEDQDPRADNDVESSWHGETIEQHEAVVSLPGSSKRQRVEEPDSEGETSSDNGSEASGSGSSSTPVPWMQDTMTSALADADVEIQNGSDPASGSLVTELVDVVRTTWQQNDPIGTERHFRRDELGVVALGAATAAWYGATAAMRVPMSRTMDSTKRELLAEPDVQANMSWSVAAHDMPASVWESPVDSSISVASAAAWVDNAVASVLATEVLQMIETFVLCMVCVGVLLDATFSLHHLNVHRFTAVVIRQNCVRIMVILRALVSKSSAAGPDMECLPSRLAVCLSACLPVSSSA